MYDPNGFYAANGQPGPYSEGNGNGVMPIQPDGRPDTPMAVDGSCHPDTDR